MSWGDTIGARLFGDVENGVGPCRVLQWSLVCVGVALAGCGGSPKSPTAPPPTPVSSVPVLSVAVVDLSLLVDFQPFGFALVNPTYKLATDRRRVGLLSIGTRWRSRRSAPTGSHRPTTRVRNPDRAGS